MPRTRRGAAGVAAARAKADEYAASLASTIREIRAGGTTTLQGVDPPPHAHLARRQLELHHGQEAPAAPGRCAKAPPEILT
jgi:hypothetical protein